MELLDYVLAYKLLKCANFSREQKQLVKATVSEYDYNKMKDQLRKVFIYNAVDFARKDKISEEKLD